MYRLAMSRGGAGDEGVGRGDVGGVDFGLVVGEGDGVSAGLGYVVVFGVGAGEVVPGGEAGSFLSGGRWRSLLDFRRDASLMADK